MPAAKFVDLIHLVTIAPGDGDLESIHCNKMVPQPVNRITRQPDETDCPQCKARLIREALAHAASVA